MWNILFHLPDDPMSVVDETLSVRGVPNLRVVDASVMPTIVGGNTHAPTVAVAEKAAQAIINKWKKVRDKTKVFINSGAEHSKDEL